MTALHTAILSLALAGATLVSPAEAAAPTTTCRGLPVTIEGEANTDILGTEGPDVIVAPFGTFGSVDAGAGNDVVCVVPGRRIDGYPDRPTYTVQGGDDDDVVDSTLLAADSLLFVPAGHGADSLFGGPAAELCFSFSNDGKPSTIDDDADVFVTGAGDDVVVSGRLGSPNPDRIDLGPGDDIVAYAGTGAVDGGRVDGGPGHDYLAPSSIDPVDPPADPLPPGDAVFDARTGTATLAGAPYLAWSGIEEYSFFEVGPTHRLTFVGTADPERVYVGQGVQDIRLGGGDDVVQQGYAELPSGEVRGGPGRDRFAMDVPGDARLDLRGRAVSTSHGVRHVMAVRGFEDARALGRSVSVRGTRGDNVLSAQARGVLLVEGRDGDDRIRAYTLNSRPILPGSTRTVRGGPGDDTMWGSGLSDVLRGGPGDDAAYGRHGRDLCVAEVRRGCELP